MVCIYANTNHFFFTFSIFLCFDLTPSPVPDFRHVLAVLVDVLFVLDELVLHHLLQAGPLSAQLRKPVKDILHQMKPVKVV